MEATNLTNYFCIQDILNETTTTMKPKAIALGTANLNTLIGYSHFRKLEGKTVVLYRNVA